MAAKPKAAKTRRPAHMSGLFFSKCIKAKAISTKITIIISMLMPGSLAFFYLMSFSRFISDSLQPISANRLLSSLGPYVLRG